jgi:hypothetical protein
MEPSDYPDTYTAGVNEFIEAKKTSGAQVHRQHRSGRLVLVHHAGALAHRDDRHAGGTTGGVIISWVVMSGANGFAVNPAQFTYVDRSFTNPGKV